MPSPLGHALGGLAVGFLLTSRAHWRLLAACVVAAALPDVDFLLPLRHRGPSHSVGAVALAGLAMYAWVKFVRPRGDTGRAAVAVALAYGTHVLFDWLGTDSSAPRGLMALWPFSSAFYISGLDVFDSVDRRYWLDGFWRRNTIAVAREVALLAPLAGAAYWATKRRKAA